MDKESDEDGVLAMGEFMKLFEAITQTTGGAVREPRVADWYTCSGGAAVAAAGTQAPVRVLKARRPPTHPSLKSPGAFASRACSLPGGLKLKRPS